MYPQPYFSGLCSIDESAAVLCRRSCFPSQSNTRDLCFYYLFATVRLSFGVPNGPSSRLGRMRAAHAQCRRPVAPETLDLRGWPLVSQLTSTRLRPELDERPALSSFDLERETDRSRRYFLVFIPRARWRLRERARARSASREIALWRDPDDETAPRCHGLATPLGDDPWPARHG